jgi:hypothetical protein
MPGKHIRAAISELEAAGWQVTYTNGRAHAYARASCPDGPGCCSPPFTINGTPDVDEHEAAKIHRRMRQHDAKVEERRKREKEG